MTQGRRTNPHIMINATSDRTVCGIKYTKNSAKDAPKSKPCIECEAILATLVNQNTRAGAV